jgi:septum formation protein
LDTLTQKSISNFTKSEVLMKNLSDKEIDAYVATNEPLDKAGAYGIQEKGLALIEEVKGDYANIVGLPITSLLKALKQLGLGIEDFWKTQTTN